MRVACPFTDRRRGARLAALGVTAALWSCAFGQSVSDYGPARSPRGVAATIVVQRAPRDTVIAVGELLEVTDSALIVLAAGGPIVRVRFGQIRWAKFAQSGTFGFVEGRRPSGARLARLRLLARFPYDSSSTLLHTLLVRMGQDTLLNAAEDGVMPGTRTELSLFRPTGAAPILLQGELLAVEDSALVLRDSTQMVVRVPYWCVADALFAGVGVPGWVGTRRVPDADARHKLGQRARFSRPLPPARLRGLLPTGIAEPTLITCSVAG